jgi:hypothetical protein
MSSGFPEANEATESRHSTQVPDVDIPTSARSPMIFSSELPTGPAEVT